jgi:tryptophan synthase beta chain
MKGKQNEKNRRSETDEIRLQKKDLPRKYFNLNYRLEVPPPTHPGTGEPLGPAAFEPLFARELAKQEFSRKKFLKIPPKVRDALFFLSRPTPLRRARALEKAIGTTCRIYFKREDATLTGSHKANTAMAQAFYAREEGIERLVTETGAGQWGTALSLACARFGIDCDVFMVKCSFDAKPGRKTLMDLFGGKVRASPSRETAFGRKLLAKNPKHPGSLGIAISEALEVVASANGRAKYALGSVLNHILIHQSVIGLEARKQLSLAGETPDVTIGCIGGGSNFAGLAYPLMEEFPDSEFVAVEPEACPSATKGTYEYDFGDTAGTTPKLKMYTLGASFVPSAIHAGGLRYHGLAPSLSFLISEGLVKPVAIGQAETFAAARLFARAEGIVPAPESSHAIAETIRLAKGRKNETLVFGLSGHGLLDLSAYSAGQSLNKVDARR